MTSILSQNIYVLIDRCKSETMYDIAFVVYSAGSLHSAIPLFQSRATYWSQKISDVVIDSMAASRQNYIHMTKLLYDVSVKLKQKKFRDEIIVKCKEIESHCKITQIL